MKTRLLILPLIALTLLISVNVAEALVSNYEIISWDDFEHEFEGNAAIFKNNLPGLGIIEAKTEYYIVQKAEFTASSFGDKDTRVDATIGYAIKKGDHMLHPPMHENATDAEHEEFSMKMQKHHPETQKNNLGWSKRLLGKVLKPFASKGCLGQQSEGKH